MNDWKNNKNKLFVNKKIYVYKYKICLNIPNYEIINSFT